MCGRTFLSDILIKHNALLSLYTYTLSYTHMFDSRVYIVLAHVCAKKVPMSQDVTHKKKKK